MQRPWIPPPCLHLWDQKQSAIGARVPSFGRQGPFVPPWLPQAVCRLLLERVHSSLLWGRCGHRELHCCARSWSWPKLTALCRPSLSPEITSLHWTLEFHSSPSRQFLMSVCDLGRETDSWCFLLHHFPRILSLELTVFYIIGVRCPISFFYFSITIRWKCFSFPMELSWHFCQKSSDHWWKG